MRGQRSGENGKVEMDSKIGRTLFSNFGTCAGTSY
jgi:hypothetical protein